MQRLRAAIEAEEQVSSSGVAAAGQEGGRPARRTAMAAGCHFLPVYGSSDGSYCCLVVGYHCRCAASGVTTRAAWPGCLRA